MSADDVLNQEIADVFGLLGVLLVFVIAFYTYLLTQAETLIAKELPAKQGEKNNLIAQLTATRRLLTALVAATALTLALLCPLLGRTTASCRIRTTSRPAKSASCSSAGS